jgi:hypothetical protein
VTRWRDKPRRTLRRWDAPREWLIGLLLAVTAGVVGIRDLVGGRIGLAFIDFAAAISLTRLVVLYLRKPLVPEDERLTDMEQRRVPPDVMLRNEAEESAREHRSGTGF